MHGVRHEEHAALALRVLVGHVHRLGRGGGLVEQRRVGQRQTGEVGDHGLVVEQRLEPTLGDLCLVGRVGGVPAGVLEHVALDDRRHDAAVVAQADVTLADPVATRQLLEPREQLVLAELAPDLAELLEPVQLERRGHADRGRDGLVDQRVEAVGLDRPQHRREVGLARADVAVDEGVAGGEEAGSRHGGAGETYRIEFVGREGPATAGAPPGRTIRVWKSTGIAA
jgi:hypothetical protein